ncbi:MAG: energy transducer TonB [Halobacteriovoraceae bacterium]|nr:energy transducer TonB [Halobacteriovoraceae bacterium]MBC97199.1 energy transducer TonB [Halobacteriovoraceae bacterium]|tara:strand:- start:85503 stop:86150 length:648 start_codon:yes stop_codon:yes gene_type:complete
MALKSKGQLYGTALVLGFPVTLVLFYIMATLVSQPVDLGSSADEQIIDFVRVASQSSLQTRQRSMPKKPPKPQKAPDMPKMSVNSQVDAPQPQMAMTSPLASDSLSFGNGPYLGGAVGGGGGGGDREVMPLVRIEPQYPRKAAMSGKEGWVKLKFDVNETGAVENVSIIDAKPPRLFNQSAKRALLKWKYQPKIVDGKPEPRRGLMVQLDFKLRR